MKKELLFEDFRVYNIDLNIFNGTLRFNLIDEETKECHKIFIDQISKIQCDINEYACTVPAEERKWQLFDFSF